MLYLVVVNLLVHIYCFVFENSSNYKSSWPHHHIFHALSHLYASHWHH